MQGVGPDLEALVERLERLISTKTVVGEPIHVGDVTLIPILDVSFGFGGGGGESREKEEGGTGAGAGAGARISSKAVLVIRGSDVTLLPIHKGGTLEKLVEALPDVISRFKSQHRQEESEAQS